HLATERGDYRLAGPGRAGGNVPAAVRRLPFRRTAAGRRRPAVRAGADRVRRPAWPAGKRGADPARPRPVPHRATGALRTSASTSKRSAIWLCESEIGGRLLCVDTVIDGRGERSIQADRMHVTGNVRLLHQFTARGEVRLIGARIGGSLDLTGARIESFRPGLGLDLGS